MRKQIHILFACLFCLLAAVSALANAKDAVREFTPDSMKSILATHKGHPFVLVIWSLDCEFCQASLNTLAKEKQQHPNLKVVTLSTDSMEDQEAGSMRRKKLESLGLAADAWAFGAMPPEQLRYALDKDWRGEMPRSYWFDAKGKSTARSGVITPAVVETFLAGH